MNPESTMTFDESFDVVVAGFGHGGAISAITAADCSAKTLILAVAAGAKLGYEKDRQKGSHIILRQNGGAQPGGKIDLVQTNSRSSTLSTKDFLCP